MKINLDPVVSSRINTAWGRLSAMQQAQFTPAIMRASHQAVSVAQTKKAPNVPAAAHHLMLAHSVLTNDADGVADSLEAGAVLDVGPDGVIWGTGKYQQFDPGWTEALAVFLENLLAGSHPFIARPQTIPIPDDALIGLAGDWGTGDWRTNANPAPSTRVGQRLRALNAHVTIHLGDVYYAGTEDQERHLLVNLWPRGSIGALALNSNHEMYSGATPYFNAISDPASPFGIQRGCSYFALENSNWVIVGLDTAYFSAQDNLYMDGLLAPAGGTTQTTFLADQVAKGKKVILLTHHNGLSEDGSQKTALWSQVMGAFAKDQGPVGWYWGHVHAGVVYAPQANGAASVRCRCSGHGALPWGHAPQFNNPHVLWYENRPAKDPDIPQRVLNGFTALHLDGPSLEEVFYDENGGVAWQASAPGGSS